MAIYHMNTQVISRGKGRSAVASSAYRAGEKLINEYDGLIHDYTSKTGVVYSEIMLCNNAPPELKDRQTLWNTIEKVEKSKNAQLAREINIALPHELTVKQNIKLVQEYVKKNFSDKGMIADVAIHDKKDGNPHAHIMLTMRPLDKKGKFGAKSKKVYILDQNGNKIKLPSGQWKSYKVDTTNWNEKPTLNDWRGSLAKVTNEHLKILGYDKSHFVDHRSYKEQQVDKIPTVHLGVTTSNLEKKGIETDRGNINRAIKADNEERAKIQTNIIYLEEYKERLLKTETPKIQEQAVKIFNIKNDYIQLSKISERLKTDKSTAEQERNKTFKTIFALSQQQQDYANLENALKKQHEKLEKTQGIFQGKERKEIKQGIENLETSKNQFINSLNRTYSIKPQEINKAITRNENELKKLDVFLEKIQSKIKNIDFEKQTKLLEYKYQIVYAKLQDKPDYYSEVIDTIKELEKEQSRTADEKETTQKRSIKEQLNEIKFNEKLERLEEHEINLIRLRLPREIVAKFDAEYGNKETERVKSQDFERGR